MRSIRPLSARHPIAPRRGGFLAVLWHNPLGLQEKRPLKLLGCDLDLGGAVGRGEQEFNGELPRLTVPILGRKAIDQERSDVIERAQDRAASNGDRAREFR